MYLHTIKAMCVIYVVFNTDFLKILTRQRIYIVYLFVFIFFGKSDKTTRKRNTTKC